MTQAWCVGPRNRLSRHQPEEAFPAAPARVEIAAADLRAKAEVVRVRRGVYWGETPDQKIDFTTMDDTAAYTAEVALDATAPRILRIAGEQIDAASIARAAAEVSGHSSV